MQPEEIQTLTGVDVIPCHRADMVYQCIDCAQTHPLERLLYTCPACGSLLRVIDRNFDALRARLMGPVFLPGPAANSCKYKHPEPQAACSTMMTIPASIIPLPQP